MRRCWPARSSRSARRLVPTPAARLPSSRWWRIAWCGSGCRRIESGPSASARRARERGPSMSEDQAMDERMRRLAEMREDPALDLSLDANAIGGLLAGIFGADVTGSDGQCASCHTVSLMGTMRVYMRGPGIVVRCPACTQVVLRVVQSPDGTMVDLRGAAYVRLAQRPMPAES